MSKQKFAIVPNKIAFAASLALLQMGSAWAQGAAALNLDEVVVTASPEGRSKMKQSQSVSSIDSELIVQSQPNSSAELLRSIPGIRSEASSGDGNANITVRGVPISAGGSRYVQFQEDGLPILLLGDFNFVTADMFTRVDYGTDGLEVVRGGGASTMASSSPGGVINFLSKTGDVKNGTVGVSYGSNNTMRTDYAMGGPLSDSTRYQVSGYYRNGEGPRDTGGVKMVNGYQIRANFTKDLGAGNFVRINMKMLDDKSPTELTVPVQIVNKQIVQAPGVDPRTYTPYGNKLTCVPNWGMNAHSCESLNDGLHVKQTAVGAEAEFGLGNGWKFNDKFRMATTTGLFSGIMPDSSIAAPFTNYTALFLGAKMNDLGNTVNDLKLTKSHMLDGAAKLSTTAGLFMMQQKLNVDWEIGAFPGFSSVSHSGANTTYNVYYKRYLNLTYNQTAPYVALGYEAGPLNLDASIRSDHQTVKGDFIAQGDAAQSAADYKSKYTSYSLGANYSLTKDLALFGRYSDGASFFSDRNTFGGTATSLVGVNVPVNTVQQTEVGFKYRSGGFSGFATYFEAKTNEANYDLTTGKSSKNKYDAKGVELELGYRTGIFRINGGVTYTNANVKESSTAGYAGLAPNRQAKLVYQVAPSIKVNNIAAGFQLIGTSGSRDAQTTAFESALPGYNYVNLFANMDIDKRWNIGASINNAFNKVGYTEVNDSRAAARSIDGRTYKLMARYSF